MRYASPRSQPTDPMPPHLKALPVILAGAFVLFWLASLAFPEAARAGEIRRQRWAVVLVTVAAIGSPSIWAYCAVLAVLAGAWLMPPGDRPARAAALWAMLLLAVPNVGADVPGFGGIERFFEMQHSRMLSLVLLVPAMLMLTPDPRRPRLFGVGTDWFVIAYYAVQLFVVLPYASRTDLVRQAVVLAIDTVLPYWVFSRAIGSPQALRNVLRGFVLTALMLCGLAVFESLKRWAVYDAVTVAWGLEWNLSFYLERAGILRAKGSTGHSLALGLVLVVGLGFWGALRGEIKASGWALLGAMGFAIGLVASLARGSWLGAVFLLFLLALLSQDAFKRGLIALCIGGLALVVVTQVPALKGFADMLPFIGNVDSENVEYRRRLLEISMSLIAQSPWLGFPGHLSYMEELRQGQGIIDIVNSYIGIALNTGLVGLACFAGSYLSMLAKLFAVRRLPNTAGEGRLVANHLIATTLAVLFIIVTTSSISVIPQVLSMLLGLGVACWRVYTQVEVGAVVQPAWMLQRLGGQRF
jgi:O-antigen ligase